MIIVKVCCILVMVKICSTKITTREMEGYPVGYLAECPGSNKEAKISPKSLKNLKLITLNERRFHFIPMYVNKTSYSYYDMKALARNLDFTKKTVVKVIGYLDSNYYTPVGSVLGTMYKDLGYNVLLLEYHMFNFMAYPKAARFLRPVGKHTAEMLAELTKYGLDPKNVELIGISHGGQAIGFIAKSYREITGKNISRITGLDSSGPCFRRNKPEDRIDASDADWVEIVHTNIEGYGMAGAVGHIDYYVNGGEFQTGDLVMAPCLGICSHIRSYFLWLAALFKPNSFIAMQCDSIQDARDWNCFERKPFITNVLGLNVDKTKQGIFFLMTNNVFPYGMGVKGLKKKNKVYDKMVGGFNAVDVMEI